MGKVCALQVQAAFLIVMFGLGLGNILVILEICLSRTKTKKMMYDLD
jgi:hypothetical protein